MILKKITIQNIRSYDGSTSIDIPTGTILFQGDIGCGKSSILLSIEFALFGLGDLDGRHLLRNGKSKGSVKLEFEVDEKPYIIFRSLARKSKNVVQDEGYLIEDGEKTDYSVSEIKARILEIINIKERIQPKTTSIIYRFAIFTPQEMMKQVLTESQDKRLEILRRAFGIEEYNTVKKNIIETGIPWLRNETKTAKELSKDLGEKKINLDIQEKLTLEISDTLAKNLDLLSGYEKQIKKFNDKLDKLEEKKEKVVRLEESIPLLKNKILNEQKEIKEDKISHKELKDDFEKIKMAENNMLLLKPKYDDYQSKRKSLADLEKSVELFTKLEKEKVKFEKTIEIEKKHLEDKIKRLLVEIKENEIEVQEKKTSIDIFDQLIENKELLFNKAESLYQFRERFQDISNNISRMETKKESFVKELDKKTKEIDQINEIGEGVLCPKCRQELTKEHIIAVTNDFKVEKTQIGQKIRKLEESLLLASKKNRENEEKIKELEKTEKELVIVGNKISELEERKKSISELDLKLKAKKSLLDEQVKTLDENKYCVNERDGLDRVEQKIKDLEKDLRSYKTIKQVIEKYDHEGIEKKFLENMHQVNQRSKIEKEIERIEKNIKEKESAVTSDQEELKIKQSMFEKDKQVIFKIKELDIEKKEIEKKNMYCKTEIASDQSKLDVIKVNISDLESEVSKKEEYFRNMMIYSQANIWTNECFIPIVEDIEQNVLSSINEEFNIMFQHWFNLLVDTGEITVEVDETFTPLISQGGYTLDVMSLSGGEKTSVALAYRLALNMMIRKTSSFKSHLLILDEPTDGFSSEQLIRLRYVLDELDSSQIIMVSHEKELESFVSTIYRITKHNGISTVQIVV